MNVDTPGNEFGKGTLSSEITHLGKIRYLVLCRVACVVVPTTKWVKICRAQKRIKITYLMHAWTADMEFFSPISFGCKPGRILFDSAKKKKKTPPSELSSLYHIVPTKKVRAAKTTGWNECCVA